jgi:hypothetical protein
MRAAVVVSVSPAAVCHECTADCVASVIHLHSSAPATPNSVLLSILNSLSCQPHQQYLNGHCVVGVLKCGWGYGFLVLGCSFIISMQLSFKFKSPFEGSAATPFTAFICCHVSLRRC